MRRGGPALTRWGPKFVPRDAEFCWWSKPTPLPRVALRTCQPSWQRKPLAWRKRCPRIPCLPSLVNPNLSPSAFALGSAQRERPLPSNARPHPSPLRGFFDGAQNRAQTSWAPRKSAVFREIALGHPAQGTPRGFRHLQRTRAISMQGSILGVPEPERQARARRLARPWELTCRHRTNPPTSRLSRGPTMAPTSVPRRRFASPRVAFPRDHRYRKSGWNDAVYVVSLRGWRWFVEATSHGFENRRSESYQGFESLLLRRDFARLLRQYLNTGRVRSKRTSAPNHPRSGRARTCRHQPSRLTRLSMFANDRANLISTTSRRESRYRSKSRQ